MTTPGGTAVRLMSALDGSSMSYFAMSPVQITHSVTGRIMK